MWVLFKTNFKLLEVIFFADISLDLLLLCLFLLALLLVYYLLLLKLGLYYII